MIEITPPDISLNGFLSVLNGDMIRDLPHYFNTAARGVGRNGCRRCHGLNREQHTHMPYGQARFEGIVADPITEGRLDSLIAFFMRKVGGFDEPMTEYDLDAVLSINNYHAANAAVAYYPGLTVPMRYYANGEPAGLTFFAPSHEEERPLGLAAAYEAATKRRRAVTAIKIPATAGDGD